MVAAHRSDGGSGAGRIEGGLYLAAKGGHNDESHNHNDIGNFIVYADGRPILIDAGVWGCIPPKRLAKTGMRSGPCSRIIIMCLPSTGFSKKTGGSLLQGPVSYQTDDNKAEFELDIAGAYPEEARVKSWVRRLTLDRKRNQIELRDRYQLDEYQEPHRTQPDDSHPAPS